MLGPTVVVGVQGSPEAGVQAKAHVVPVHRNAGDIDDGVDQIICAFENNEGRAVLERVHDSPLII